MKYVYLLESVNFPTETYIGLTDDLRACVSAPTVAEPRTPKFKPWRLITYLGFSDSEKAVAFERYKSASGRAFAIKDSIAAFGRLFLLRPADRARAVIA